MAHDLSVNVNVQGACGYRAGELAEAPRRRGVPSTAASRVAKLPSVSVLFAAFLGYSSPIQHLLGSSLLSHLLRASVAALTRRSFFPDLIARPLQNGLHEAFDFAVLACLVAAAPFWLRGGKYVFVEPEVSAVAEPTETPPDGGGMSQKPDSGNANGHAPSAERTDARRTTALRTATHKHRHRRH